MSSDDDWDAWGPDIIEAVKTGELDRHLRGIVRAAFKRKKPSHVLPDRVTVKLAPAASPPSPMASPFGEGSLPLLTHVPLSNYQKASPGTFVVDGYWYDKLELIGKVFRPDWTAMPERRGTVWRGVTLYVLEINVKRFVAVMVDRPQRLDTRLAYAYKNRRPIVVDNAVLRLILER